MRLWQTNPLGDLMLVKGEGCRVIDADGKSYLDLLAGTWCNVLGTGHPRWLEAVRDQAGKLVHTGERMRTLEVEEALAELAAFLPEGLDRAVLLNTGSGAVELALKMAHAATGGTALAVVHGSYYGATTYALSLSELGLSYPWLPQSSEVLRLPAPDCRRCPEGSESCAEHSCLDPLRHWEALAEGRVAAVLVEPILAGRVIVPPTSWLAELKELAASGGALLVDEEVTTGMGRTGRWFACDWDSVTPDLLAIGKALGAGLPVAAVASTAQVEEACQEALSETDGSARGGTFRHIQSHQNDPFSGRVAATVIRILQEEKLVERAGHMGEILHRGLEELSRKFTQITQVRGRGLMLGVELRPEAAEWGARVQMLLQEMGFLVDYKPVVPMFRLFPPYVISEEEIASFLEAFRRTARWAEEQEG